MPNSPVQVEPPPTQSSEIDQDRYSRQILFPGIGLTGQQHLARAHVAVIGCGATGAATASLLARAGIGTLTLIDRDFVEPSNLQRQILFDESDARDALPKAEAARRHIARFNSTITVHPRIADLTPANIAEILAPASAIDLFLDCTDNFETRYLLNDYAVQQTKPWIYAAAVGAYAATMNILPRHQNPNRRLTPPPPASPASSPHPPPARSKPATPPASSPPPSTSPPPSRSPRPSSSSPANPTSSAAPCSPSISGPATAPRSTPPAPPPAAPSATFANSPTSPATIAPTSPSADATPSRSTSTSAPSTFPPCAPA
jgi:molybdopterin/thiamine biosynthesis adenylyltransferase